MTFGAYLHSFFTNTQYLEFALLLIIACVVGLMIGIERSSYFRGVGSFTPVYRKTEIDYEDFKAFLATCPEIRNATLSYL